MNSNQASALPEYASVKKPKSPSTPCSLMEVDIYLEKEACFIVHPPRKAASSLTHTEPGN